MKNNAAPPKLYMFFNLCSRELYTPSRHARTAAAMRHRGRAPFKLVWNKNFHLFKSISWFTGSPVNWLMIWMERHGGTVALTSRRERPAGNSVMATNNSSAVGPWLSRREEHAACAHSDESPRINITNQALTRRLPGEERGSRQVTSTPLQGGFQI